MSEVERAIDEGAATREAVTSACSAGGDCGACHHAIEQIIEDRGLVKAERTVRGKRAA